MSNEGFPPTPPSGGTIPATPRDASTASRLTVQILHAPQQAQPKEGQAQTLKGEIVAVHPREHAVTIRTPNGNVEIRLSAEKPLPQRGTEVELKILPREGQKTQMGTLRVTAEPITIERPQNISAQRPPSYAPPHNTTTPPAPPPNQTLPNIQGQATLQISRLPPQQFASLQLSNITATITSMTANTAITGAMPQTTPLPNTELLQTSPHSRTSIIPLSTLATTSSAPLFVTNQTPPSPAQSIILELLKMPSPLTVQTMPEGIQSIQTQNSRSSLPAPIIFPSATVTQALSPQSPAQNAQTINAFIAPSPVTSSAASQPQTTFYKSLINIGIPEITSQVDITKQLLPQPIITKPGSNITPHQLSAPKFTALQNTLFQPAQIPATVIGLTPASQPIIALQTPLSSAPEFFVVHNATAQAGTHISIPAHSITTKMTSMMGLPFSDTQNMTLFQSSWPALEELTNLLSSIQPQIAQNMLQMTPTPQNPSLFGSAFMFLVAAMRSGDITSWLGDRPLDILKQMGKSDLAQRLSRDFGALSRFTSETLPNDWRGLALPMSYQNELHNIVLYYKKEEQEEPGNKGKVTQTRFIFDLSLNRMGPVQIDGLFKPTRLNMVIRTETDLSEPMKQAIRQNYAAGLRTAELTGEITFQPDKSSFLKIIDSSEKIGLFT